MTADSVNHTIEPELCTGTPRQVRFTRTAFAFRMFFWMFFGAIGIACLCLSFKDIQEIPLLAARGRTAEASVTSKREVHENTNCYYLDYIFAADHYLNPAAAVDTHGVTDGQMVPGEQIVSEAMYDRTPVGSPLLITYLPSHPNVHRLGRVDQTRVNEQERTWLLIDGTSIGVLALVSWFIERLFLRQRYLLREGVPVPGQITRLTAPRAGSRDPNYYFYYDYTVPGAGTFHGRDSVAPKQAKLLEKQTTATVLIDSKAPKKSCLYAGLGAVALINK